LWFEKNLNIIWWIPKAMSWWSEIIRVINDRKLSWFKKG
jgi:hypothetical protein